MTFPWLSILVWLPFLAGLGLAFSPKLTGNRARAIALALTVIEALLLIPIGSRVIHQSGLQFTEHAAWLPSLGLDYYLAMDGISIAFVALTLVVFWMALIVSKETGADGRYYGWMLLLEGGLLGTFLTQNFLHFFLYWELSLIPAFLLVKSSGGPRRFEAALQFFTYTMAGSIGILIAFLAINRGAGTLNLPDLLGVNGQQPSALMQWRAMTLGSHSTVLFLLAFAAVAVKLPIWPLHSWQPLTYSEAPTPVTMVLTGAMSKMGVYGMLRWILPVFPNEIDQLHKPLLALAVITILYGALAAFGQRDIKRLFAYSSLSHLGYCMLGLIAAARSGAAGLGNERAAAINGVILQVISHGLLAAALFGFVCFLERRAGGLRTFENFGGLRKVNPKFAGLMGIAVFASLGLPGLSGFPAEFLILKGSFALAPAATSAAVLGLLLTAIYLLSFFRKVFLGPLHEKRAGSPELSFGELAAILPAIVLTFLFGFAPQIGAAFFNPAVTGLLKQLGS